ncbi:MAG: hypothetical protein ABSG95_06650 [Solirubrobacteraceae bacterium]|jgi:hypothetical protein
MNARAEAAERLRGRYDARVLEPSPPAVSGPPWFADDPVGREDPPLGLPRVSPVAGGDLRWDELILEEPGLADWCAARWLGAYRRLRALPAELVSTRVALHRLAEEVISPARAHSNGKIGLRFTRGGFGTPFFAEDVQVRVAGDQLILQTSSVQRSATITTLSEMAEHLGEELLPRPGLDTERLEVDADASAFLGDWFGFGASVLEELRAGASEELEPSRVQLWPEHFDLSVEIGSEHDGWRAGYGASPGDELHAAPYLYVVPWGELPGGELWRATAFRGAELPYATLQAARDQRGAALAFFGERLAALELGR